MTFAQVHEEDLPFLQRAIEIAEAADAEAGYTPFGAVVTVDGRLVGEGRSSVLLLRDPTAHAEVMAIRDAARKLDNHLVERGVMYSSTEPCPLCLAACYWAGIERLVYASTSRDAAIAGFDDEAFYAQLALPNPQRTRLVEVAADGAEQIRAQAVLAAWAKHRRGRA